ncbi:MAG: hypothetical protein EBS18_06935, partial [Actinobacteria bacterium]|nr:hypothetical protein [Actinomycetota bacterium]
MSSVFDDLIDQEAVIATLKAAVAASKDLANTTQGMTHSWLFTGPPGSGRSNAAISFAAALLCEKSGCGVCINCLTVKDGSHADIELIRTEGLSIKVDEVSEFVRIEMKKEDDLDIAKIHQEEQENGKAIEPWRQVDCTRQKAIEKVKPIERATAQLNLSKLMRQAHCTSAEQAVAHLVHRFLSVPVPAEAQAK